MGIDWDPWEQEKPELFFTKATEDKCKCNQFPLRKGKQRYESVSFIPMLFTLQKTIKRRPLHASSRSY